MDTCIGPSEQLVLSTKSKLGYCCYHNPQVRGVTHSRASGRLLMTGSVCVFLSCTDVEGQPQHATESQGSRSTSSGFPQLWLIV
jgi:hypothetical protein